MGIINITPDSFSDGGKFLDPQAALAQASRHIAEGADILDLGGETTRPGSEPTSQEEEWRRLAPVLSGLRDMPNLVPVSVDTYKASIAEKAVLSGAAILNDIYAGRKDPDILKVAASFKVPIILMHMQGDPRTMQLAPFYNDVVKEVREFLLERAQAAMEAGVPQSHIILDPGLGFGKNADHNLTLIKRFDEVIPEGFHSLMALSRKAFLGHILGGAAPMDRDLATAMASGLAIMKGAQIVRVHSVFPTMEASKVVNSVMGAV
jgi:dihydropteroate synthase